MTTNFNAQAENADKVFQGKVCCDCGTEFIEIHGYPVLCNACFFESSEEDKEIYTKSIKKEM